MTAKFLVATGIEEEWAEKDNLFLLGEWCNLYCKKEKLQKKSFYVQQYHWDNQQKFRADYKYLERLYEELLIVMAEKLNFIHNEDYSLRYWRILIGPWLFYFIHAVYDRWETLSKALNKHKFSGTTYLKIPDHLVIAKNMSDFISLFLADEWNHSIFQEILKFKGNPIPYTTQDVKLQNLTPFRKNILKQKISKAIRFLGKITPNLFEKKIVFLNTRLPLREKFFIALRFKQLNCNYEIPACNFNQLISEKLRAFSIEAGVSGEFEVFLRGILIKQIPIAYLEGYGYLKNFIKNKNLPQNPSAICTASCYENDALKHYLAISSDSGSKVFIMQHGGHYGLGRFSSCEDHEIAISDNFLSWGWKGLDESKIIPVGRVSRKSYTRKLSSSKKIALLVCGTAPRYSYRMWSGYIGPQYLSYLHDQFAFYDYLPSKIREFIVVRLHAEDYSWSSGARWKQRFSKINVDDGLGDIGNLMMKSKVYIATYNATTFLESLSMNVPTIIFWNPCHWELRHSALDLFIELKRVGIFHDTPQSAALQLSKVWDNIDEWWLSKEVQAIRISFCEHYAKGAQSFSKYIEEAVN